MVVMLTVRRRRLSVSASSATHCLLLLFSDGSRDCHDSLLVVGGALVVNSSVMTSCLSVCLSVRLSAGTALVRVAVWLLMIVQLDTGI